MTDNNKSRPKKAASAQTVWQLSAAEKKAISAVAAVVLFACTLAPYVQPHASGGLQLFAISLGVSVAGGLLIVVAIRLFAKRTKPIKVGLLSALLILICAGLIGGVVGYLISPVPKTASTASTAGHRRTLPATQASPATSPSAQSTASPPAGAPASRLFTEIADNRNGIPVFGSPDGRTTNAPKIPFATRVKVACYAPNLSGIISINKFYLIKSPPWNNVYAPANTFANGDPVGQPGSTNIDAAVPRCRR